MYEYGIEGDSMITSKTVADHSEAQNGGWFEATEQEIAQWEQGEIVLYSENYYIKFLEI